MAQLNKHERILNLIKEHAAEVANEPYTKVTNPDNEPFKAGWIRASDLVELIAGFEALMSYE